MTKLTKRQKNLLKKKFDRANELWGEAADEVNRIKGVLRTVHGREKAAHELVCHLRNILNGVEPYDLERVNWLERIVSNDGK